MKICVTDVLHITGGILLSMGNTVIHGSLLLNGNVSRKLGTTFLINSIYLPMDNTIVYGSHVFAYGMSHHHCLSYIKGPRGGLPIKCSFAYKSLAATRKNQKAVNSFAAYSHPLERVGLFNANVTRILALSIIAPFSLDLIVRLPTL